MTTAAPAMADFCCAEHPITGALCSRISCTGQHSADGDDWTEPDDDTLRRNA